MIPITSKLVAARLLAEEQHRGQSYGPYSYMKHINDCTVVLEYIYDQTNTLYKSLLSKQVNLNDVDWRIRDSFVGSNSPNFSSQFYNTLMIIVILHDSLEDGNITYNDLKKEFGELIADAVYSVTDDMGKNRKERKNYARIRSNMYGRIAKLIDRYANSVVSKETKSGMFKKYQSEFADFREGVAVPDNEMHLLEVVMWIELEKLYGYDD